MKRVQSNKVKIKPVEPSEIKDKTILREALAQIHRKPTTEDWAYVQAREEMLQRTMKK